MRPGVRLAPVRLCWSSWCSRSREFGRSQSAPSGLGPLFPGRYGLMRSSDPVTLKGQIYSSRLRGSLPIDLLLAAQAHGLIAESYKGSLDNVRSELEAGHPL